MRKILQASLVCLLCFGGFAQAQTQTIVVSLRLSATFRITTSEIYSSTGGNKNEGRMTKRANVTFDIRQWFRDSLQATLNRDKRYKWVSAAVQFAEVEDQLWTWQSLTYQRPRQLGASDKLLLIELVDLGAVETGTNTYVPQALVNAKLIDDINKKNLWQFRSPQSTPRFVSGDDLDAAMKTELQALASKLGESLLNKLR